MEARGWSMKRSDDWQYFVVNVDSKGRDVN